MARRSRQQQRMLTPLQNSSGESHCGMDGRVCQHRRLPVGLGMRLRAAAGHRAARACMHAAACQAWVGL